MVGGLEIFYFYVLKEMGEKVEFQLATVKNPKIKDVKYVPISGKLFLKQGGAKFGQLSLFIGLVWHLLTSRKRPDLIHLPATSASGFYGKLFPWLSKRFNIPYVIVNHGGGMKPWKAGDGNPELYKAAHKVYGVSSDICEELAERAQRKVHRLLPMVPYNNSGKSKAALRAEFKLPEDAYIYLMVGSLKPLKGSNYVLNEFLSLDPNWVKAKKKHLLFVGNGVDADGMQKRAEASELAEHIHFVRFIPNEKICELYELADRFIMASDYEGTSKALLEAMAKRLPIFATDVNGINNILKHGYSAVLFEKNPGQLSQALLDWDERVTQQESHAEKAFDVFNREYHFNLTIGHLKSIYGL